MRFIARRCGTLILGRILIASRHACSLHRVDGEGSSYLDLLTGTARQLRITGTLMLVGIAVLPHQFPSPCPRQEDNIGNDEAPTGMQYDVSPFGSRQFAAQILGCMVGVHICPLLAWYLIHSIAHYCTFQLRPSTFHIPYAMCHIP